MTSYAAPMCLSCKNFNGGPMFIGDSGKCDKFPLIPKEIFYQCAKCLDYDEYENPIENQIRKK